MFLQVSVCPQGGGACVAGGVHGGGMVQGVCAWWGVCMAGGACMVGVCVLQGGMHGRGHVWLGGVHGGVHSGGHVWQGEACMARGHAWQGGHVWQILRDTVNERSVCILPECILVLVKLSKSKSQLVHSDSKVSDGSGRSRNYQRDAILSGGSRISQMGVPTEDGVTNLLLPPTNEVWGKVIFLHLSDILFTGGVPGQVPSWTGTPPLWAGTPLSRYTAWQVHPPERYTP